MGSIYKRGNTYWIKYYKKGKYYRESSGSDKKMVAQKKLAIREGEIAEGKMPGIQFEKVTFDELADEFIVDYRINKKKSLDRAELSIKHLRKEFQGLKITQLTSPKIQEYVAKRLKWGCGDCNAKFHFEGQEVCPKCYGGNLVKGSSNATINRELSALKRLLTLGSQQTPPKVDRVPYIKMLKENNIRKGFFEHKDFLGLVEALPDYLKPMIIFGYRVGWRMSEISRLKWDCVDINNGIVTLKVGETKNDDARTVYLDDELKLMFESLWEKRLNQQNPPPYVFLNRTQTGPIVNIKKSWNIACRTIGIGYGYRISTEYIKEWSDKLEPGPIFHDFRRTAVRNMTRSGIPERVAMMLSGHKTRSVFDRYNIVNDSDILQASRKQQKYLEHLDSQVGTVLGTIS